MVLGFALAFIVSIEVSFGGPCGIRTRDLFHAMEALYQLS